jgi:transcription elongation factor GreA
VERQIVLTPEGHRKLKEEIDYLSTKKRAEVAERIHDARQYGDITENSEYDDAKNEQAMVEQRISQLEDRLRGAVILDAATVSTDIVGIGTKVTLQDIKSGEVVQYMIVGSAEADPTDHRLSNESPVGRAIIGRKAGEKVTVKVPKGSLQLKVLAIDRA